MRKNRIIGVFIQPTITGEPTMIERSTTSIMAVKNSDHDSSNS